MVAGAHPVDWSQFPKNGESILSWENSKKSSTTGKIVLEFDRTEF